MKKKAKKTGSINGLASKNKEGQLVYTIIMLKQSVEMHQKHNISQTAAMFSYQYTDIIGNQSFILIKDTVETQ